MRQPRARPIKLHFFFRPQRPGVTYSIERAFEAMTSALPADRFIVRRLVCPLPSKGLMRRIALILWAAAHQGDVNHLTGDVDFIGLLMHRRTVLTIHDTASAHRLRGWRNWLFRLLWLKLPIRSAGVCTVVSQHTKDEVRRFAGERAAAIRVVPNCVTVPLDIQARSFRAERPRILHVGTAPNKNFERIVAALAEVPCVLVIVGPLTGAQRDLLNRASLPYESHEALSDTDLVEKYRTSDLLVFASTYEGFGLPILEAQALALPVVTSDIEPMRSVAGEGAVLVDPFDIGSIRTGVAKVVEDENLRKAVTAAGAKNVQQYLPPAIAARHAAIYEELVYGRSP